ncbi:hypothetical protein [Paraflavitalea speifideaquila]|nr:hypothetical protein [Paraflavitalea speifideiaquila]
MPDISIIVKGAGKGTKTDEKGAFTLGVSRGHHHLLFCQS